MKENVNILTPKWEGRVIIYILWSFHILIEASDQRNLQEKIDSLNNPNFFTDIKRIVHQS
jgi:hypothetical protein